MGLRIEAAILTLCMVPTLVSAQSLCGIDKAHRNVDRIDVTFRPDKNFRITRSGSASKTELSLANGVLRAPDGKTATSLTADTNSIVFLHERSDVTCILRMEERDDVVGLYIEEIYHVAGKPPRLATEFIHSF